MLRGRIAAAVAAAGVGLVVLAIVQAAAFAVSGAYLLLAAPVLGLPVALRVYRALHRVCTTRSRSAEVQAVAGILLLIAMAILGISFGGLALLPPAALLAVAAALTPRPPGGATG